MTSLKIAVACSREAGCFRAPMPAQCVRESHQKPNTVAQCIITVAQQVVRKLALADLWRRACCANRRPPNRPPGSTGARVFLDTSLGVGRAMSCIGCPSTRTLAFLPHRWKSPS
jgi:hypothetical protein